MVEQPFLASNDSFFGAFDELLAIFLWKKICLNRLGKMFFCVFVNLLLMPTGGGL